jgi:hypothetical protein
MMYCPFCAVEDEEGAFDHDESECTKRGQDAKRIWDYIWNAA